MGTTIIIPHSDFSGVAVDIIPPTPSVPTADITLSGAGVSTNFTEGQYYIVNNNTTPTGIALKGSGDTTTLIDLTAGTILSYKGFYFIAPVSEETRKYLPYYNSQEITTRLYGGFRVDGQGLIYRDNTIAWQCCEVELNNGETLLFNSYGGSGVKALYVKNALDVVSTEDESTEYNFDIKTYTNNTGSKVTAYISYPNLINDLVFIAKSIDV